MITSDIAVTAAISTSQHCEYRSMHCTGTKALGSGNKKSFQIALPWQLIKQA
jgi:hypothetical protein